MKADGFFHIYRSLSSDTFFEGIEVLGGYRAEAALPLHPVDLLPLLTRCLHPAHFRKIQLSSLMDQLSQSSQ